jgi:sulfur carrier protein ThiS
MFPQSVGGDVAIVTKEALTTNNDPVPASQYKELHVEDWARMRDVEIITAVSNTGHHTSA